MPRKPDNGQPTLENRFYYIFGALDTQIAGYASDMGIPKQLLAERVAAFLDPEGVRMQRVLPSPVVSESAAAGGSAAREVEMGGSTHSGETPRSERVAAHEVKLRIMSLLQKGELGSSDIAAKTNVKKNLILYHLASLRKEGIVTQDKTHRGAPVYKLTEKHGATIPRTSNSSGIKAYWNKMSPAKRSAEVKRRMEKRRATQAT